MLSKPTEVFIFSTVVQELALLRNIGIFKYFPMKLDNFLFLEAFSNMFARGKLMSKISR